MAEEPQPTPPAAAPPPQDPVAAPHHAHPTLPGLRFLDEIKRRNVGRVAVLYVIVCYLALEVLGVFVHILELPAWIGRSVVLLMVICFPIALLIAWIYEITPDGLRPTDEVPAKQSIRHQTGKRLDRAIIATLSVALVYFIVDKFWLSRQTEAHAASTNAADGAAASAAAGSRAAGTSTTPTTAISDKSIAVLPFVDMSEKHDQEYFSDGLSEELIDLLVKVPDLRVPAPTSAFYFKGKQVTIGEIAKALGVAHVLEGSVRKSGNMLRITTQLIRVDSGLTIWSQTYDRPLADIFTIQDDVAKAVVTALKTSLLLSDSPKVDRPPPIEAYTSYLQARALFQHQTPEDDARAVVLLRHAIQLDSGYAPAWAELANLLVDQAGSFSGEPYSYRAEAREAAEQALKTGPALADTHASMANVLFNLEWDWRAAQSETDTALRLQPGNVRALGLAYALATVYGRLDQALLYAEQAERQDPVDGRIYSRLFQAQFHLGHLTDAESSMRKSLELDPTASFKHWALALLYIAKGDNKTALKEAQLEPTYPFRQFALDFALDALGRRQEADVALGRLTHQYAEGGGFNIAQIYAQRGDLDEAYHWLEFAYKQRDGGLPFAGTDRLLIPLHRDARWKPFLRKMNLPE